MRELNYSKVHRDLDMKLKIGALEALDLLVVLILSAFMSIFFSGGWLGFLFVFVMPVILLVALSFFKRNKPEGYIKDLIKYSALPGFFSASLDPLKEKNFKQSIIKGGVNE